jgi:hypothetical protein
MADVDAKRRATLRVEGSKLIARVPHELSAEDFGRVAQTAYQVVHGLTGCNCLSGRISFVVEDIFEDVIQVELSGG